jgi:hypothetical protein
MDVDSQTSEKYLRIASISIALYEWVFFLHLSNSDPVMVCSDCSERYLHSAMWSHSPQNGGFTEGNLQFFTSGVYTWPFTFHYWQARSRSALPAFYSSSYGILIPSWKDFCSHQWCSYVSIVVMLISNYGVLATSFTQESCQDYYMLAPIFKGLSCRCSPTRIL